MKKDNGLKQFDDVLKSRKPTKKPPAYKWQDLALRVIEELDIPNFKRNAVFKVCKEHPRNFIEKCLNDTKELVEKGEKWRYFFKLIAQE
jgi:hypothetical protein